MLKIRILSLLFLGLLLSGTGFSAEAYDVEKTIDVVGQKIEYTGRNNSNVFIVTEGGRRLYFKECLKKEEIHEYVKSILRAYVSGVMGPTSITTKEEEELLSTIMKSDENFNKFIHMGAADKVGHELTKYFKSGNGSRIGLDGHFSENLQRELPDLLRYMSRCLIQYHNNENIAVGGLQDDIVTRGLATVRIAKLLGLSDVIVDAKYTVLKEEDRSDRFGIIMEEAKGISCDNVAKMTTKKLSPNFQREINDLQILDAVCGQVSHAPHNYFVTISGECEISSVQAFDHDKSFSCGIDLTKKNATTPPIINKEGEITIPYLSKKTAKSILELEDEAIEEELKDILTTKEIGAVKNRVLELKKAIRHTCTVRPTFLLEDSGWNNDTIMTQLTEGETYLHIFCAAVDIRIY